MKKGKILSLIQEHSDKEELRLVNMNEDSFYDGYKFVDYGKNIPNITLLTNDEQNFSVKKEKVVINWGAKFQFRNSGIEGTQIDILSLVAPVVASGEEGNTDVEMNYAEYKFEVSKQKNVESNDVQMYVSGIEIDVENKTVNVVIEI